VKSTTTSGEVELHYSVLGSGPPLLLIAGTGYPGATWPPELINPLARDFSVITYDHRGTGTSQGSHDPYSTRLFAEDAVRVLDAIDRGPADVVGHSMGGRVAQWLAYLKPDRVKNLVLAATGAGRSTTRDQGANCIPTKTVVRLVDLGYEGFIRDRQRRTFFTEEFAEAHPAIVDWLGDAFWDNRPSLADYLKHVIARQTHDSGEVLSAIGQPTMVLVGDRDTHPGDTGSHLAQSQYLASHMPNAHLVTLHGMRHGFFWQDPTSSVQAIGEWLTNDRE
jgi:pimeloyl-ACP methyl ester carboxylesterase